MFCMHCGKQLPDGAKFCMQCGAKLNTNVSEQKDNIMLGESGGLVQAKCTNCGAALEVNPSLDAAICPYCNTPYIVKKAINNFNINVSGNVNVKEATINVGGFNVDNLIARAKAFEEACDYNAALEYYNKVLDIDVNNLEANEGLKRVKYYDENYVYCLASSVEGKVILKYGTLIYRKPDGEEKKYPVATLTDINSTLGAVSFSTPGKFFPVSVFCGSLSTGRYWKNLLINAVDGNYPEKNMKKYILANYNKENWQEAVEYCMECTGCDLQTATKRIDSILMI